MQVSSSTGAARAGCEDALSTQRLSRIVRDEAGHGTIADTTLIHAPSSTSHQGDARDQEMYKAKKGNRWYFGMKAHMGVDAKTRLIHSMTTTAANVADNNMPPALLLGRKTEVYGD